MCGFCGFTGSIENSQEIINKMIERITHRGPDSTGVHYDENITLGFARLSIVGLEDGLQPIYNEDKSLVIVFNGEIYNHKELRESLIEKGHVFYTNADTEVLVHLYEEYGEKMLDYLRGMFAFVVYDMKNKEMFAVRDFFGIKPFYYSIVDEELVFGSEIKSILEYPNFKKELNHLALENYLTFQYSVLDETFFKGIYKLRPGHFIKFKDNKLEIKQYFSAEFAQENDMTLEDAIESVDNVLEDSVNIHTTTADVEVGSFLSSGVDSSYVAARFGGQKVFTVGFSHHEYNEIEFAKGLSEELGLKHHSKTITKDEYFEILPKIQYHMDEPLADPSAVAFYFVSELASKHVKVALSGEGADELFGGYNIYKEPLDLKAITNLPMFLRRFLGKIASIIPFKFKGKNFLIRGSQTIEERFIGNAKIFSKKERESILKNPLHKFEPRELTKPFFNKVANQDDITKMQYIDINFWLIGDILLKADKMSMAHSLEVRVPFLDKKVFEVAKTIPTKWKINNTSTKYAFRMAAKKHLPDVTADKKKLGFPVPIRIWLKEDDVYSMVKTTFASEVAKNFFNSEKLLKILNSHRAGKADNSRKIWTVYMFLVWHNEFF